MLHLEQELSNNSYPGRGIVIGRSADGRYAVPKKATTFALKSTKRA